MQLLAHVSHCESEVFRLLRQAIWLKINQMFVKDELFLDVGLNEN